MGQVIHMQSRSGAKPRGAAATRPAHRTDDVLRVVFAAALGVSLCTLIAMVLLVLWSVVAP